MVASTPDHAPPQPDFDVPAARAAEAHYRAALAAGATEATAWAEAVDLFRMHCPAWPRPLAEREAARVVGGLIGAGRIAWAMRPERPPRLPPAFLLRRLAQPSSMWNAMSNSAEGIGAASAGIARLGTGPLDMRPAAASR